ncbi:MAG TPA: bacteriohemerythrin [Rhodocyclaceae bacterium]|jgi:hemerythrin|nr:bacteriohemerythrin [Rhodocyclaceae bacterium]
MSADSQSLPPIPKTDTEVAYDRFVPHQFLELLGKPSIVDVGLGDHVEKELTLLFSDIRDFTTLSESILPAENFRFINSYLSTMEPMVAANAGIVDKFIGDGIMALFPGSADDGVRAGIDMLRQLVTYNMGRARAGYVPIRIGIGVNTGLVMMGTVGGHNRMDSTVIGDAVNLASRLEGLTKNYGVPLIISEHTFHSLADRQQYSIRFLDRLRVKGRYQAQSVYEVFDADPEPLWVAKKQTKKIFEEALAYFHMGHPEMARPLLDECLKVAPDDKAARTYLDRCLEAERSGVLQHAGESVREIGWRDEYSVSIGEIDAQHREMLGRIAELSDQIGRGNPEAEHTLAGLTEFIRQHFATEENLMGRYAYPFQAEHLRQHQTFLRSLDEFKGEVACLAANRLYLLFRIQLLLVDWQINHTTKSDLHLGHFLLRAGLS